MREPTLKQTADIGQFVRKMHDKMDLCLDDDDLYDFGEALLRLHLLTETDFDSTWFEKKLLRSLTALTDTARELLEEN